MVVNDTPGHVSAEASERGKALCVHQDDSIDGLGGQVLGLAEGQLIPVERQEAAEVTVRAAWEHRHRVRIQLGGPQQRGQTIEIGVLVGQDDDQITPTSLPTAAKVSSTRSS
jgi:hypothetical protein